MEKRWLCLATAALLTCSGLSYGGYYVTVYDECGRPGRKYVSEPARKGMFGRWVQVRNGERVDVNAARGPASRKFSRERARAAHTIVVTPRPPARCNICCDDRHHHHHHRGINQGCR